MFHLGPGRKYPGGAGRGFCDFSLLFTTERTRGLRGSFIFIVFFRYFYARFKVAIQDFLTKIHYFSLLNVEGNVHFCSF